MGLRSAPFLACRHPLSVSFILQNSNGIYTGFIKVQMELCKAAQPPPSLSGGGCMNTLHISSTNTVGEVIEALLKKFLVTESPTKFALYKRCHREDQVYACKLSDREHPLYLRLVAGPRTDTLSFVLREHEIGEVSEGLFTVASDDTGELACSFKEVED